MACVPAAGQLSTDDLNSLIAHAHRRIDQLNRELAEQRVREQQHIEAALEKQKLEDKKAFEAAVAKALERHKNEIELEQERKVKWLKHPVKSLGQKEGRGVNGKGQRDNCDVVGTGRLHMGDSQAKHEKESQNSELGRDL